MWTCAVVSYFAYSGCEVPVQHNSPHGLTVCLSLSFFHLNPFLPSSAKINCVRLCLTLTHSPFLASFRPFINTIYSVTKGRKKKTTVKRVNPSVHVSNTAWIEERERERERESESGVCFGVSVYESWSSYLCLSTQLCCRKSQSQFLFFSPKEEEEEEAKGEGEGAKVKDIEKAD